MLVKSIITGFIAGLAAAQSTTTRPTPSTHCETATETAFGIIPSGVEQFSWLSSLNSKYFTEGHTWTGSRVPVYTSVYTMGGNITQTGFAYLETGILEAEGYDIVPSTVTVTDCATSPTGTGSSEECTPHEDHWHCPPGVEEPSHPPVEHEHESGMPEPSATPCKYHAGSWHCPEGVPEPGTSDPDAEQEGLAVAGARQGFFALSVALIATHVLLV